MPSIIPQPPAFPVIGNLLYIDAENPFRGFAKLAKQYGPIFRLNILGRDAVFVNSVELLDEICDESRFEKVVSGALKEVRNGVHDGLFTAYPHEENWGIAHRVLMPAFGPMAIREMFEEMHDLASQLVLKWARQGANDRIQVTDDFTRLTLDSIALCAMGKRFNSYYHEELHPFVTSMVDFLSESGARTRRTSIQAYFMRDTQYRYEHDIALMKKTCIELVGARRQHPNDKKDLLNAMLKGIDSKTGQALTDDMIYNNMITFLIAGHETTSGLLSFLFYYLLKNPSAFAAAQKEVDTVVGKGSVTVDHMSKLPYITACLREALRLQPTAPAFSVGLKTDGPSSTQIGKEKYTIKRGTSLVAVLPVVHRDPAVYGDDAEEFRPERMLEEQFQKLPKSAWKPFGNGMRGCIGRAFAWQEALLATCMLLQYFDCSMADPSYELEIKNTLTIKPHNFYMHAKLRTGFDAMDLEHTMYGGTGAGKKHAAAAGAAAPVSTNTKSSLRPMKVFYGSNTGTCQAFAQGLASNAANHGYAADVLVLDDAIDKIPTTEPVVLITSSFEGEPPDNAARFTKWVRAMKGSELANVKYAVFGCGHADWRATFHKIPKEFDRTFESRGAKRLTPMGSADAALNAMSDDFDHWEPSLWSAIEQEFGEVEQQDNGSSDLNVDVSTQKRPTLLQQSLKEVKIVKNTIISADDAPVERHVELQLPEGMTYRAGDYLAILPMNPQPTVRRVLKHFSLPWDTVITVANGTGRLLPGVTEGSPMPLVELLAGFVELTQPATKKSIEALSKTIPDATEASKVADLGGSIYDTAVLKPRISVLDLLEQHSTATLSLGAFLAMQLPMRIRQYSISSSSLASPNTCSITIGVLEAPSFAAKDKRFLGVASNYMAWLEAGDTIHAAVRQSHQAFHLPSDPADAATTPILMFCAGTGIAPFRGFVQERVQQLASGQKLARAILYLGVRREKDLPYRSELEKWQDAGAVELRYVFSREQEKSKGCKYVQDRAWAEREEIVELFAQGARVYVCGSAGLGEGIREVAVKMRMERSEKKGKMESREEAGKWWDSIRNERYAVDVFT